MRFTVISSNEAGERETYDSCAFLMCALFKHSTCKVHAFQSPFHVPSCTFVKLPVRVILWSAGGLAISFGGIVFTNEKFVAAKRPNQ